MSGLSASQSTTPILQLPSWSFGGSSGGVPGSGEFTTDNSSPASTSVINISNTSFSGDSLAGLLSVLYAGCIISLTGKSGSTLTFSVNSPATSGGSYLIFQVSSVGSNTPFSGKYYASFVSSMPTLSQILAAAGIVPATDGTTTPVTSITTQSGVVTAKL